MKRLLMIIPLIFLCCLGCQQNQNVAAVDVEADIQAIKDIFPGLLAAFNSDDLNNYLSIYADDAVMFPPANPPSVGKQAIGLTIQQWFNEYSFQSKYEILDVDVSGTMAIAHISFDTTTTSKTGGEPEKENGNWLLIFKKQSDDTWKAIYDMWTNESLIYPDEKE